LTCIAFYRFAMGPKTAVKRKRSTPTDTSTEPAIGASGIPAGEVARLQPLAAVSSSPRVTGVRSAPLGAIHGFCRPASLPKLSRGGGGPVAKLFQRRREAS